MTTHMVDLDALVNDARLPRARVCGREVVVRPLTAAMAHRVAVVTSKDATGADTLAVMLDLVRAAVPALTADEIASLTVNQIGAIIQLSRGQVDEVEAALKAQSDAEGNG